MYYSYVVIEDDQEHIEALQRNLKRYPAFGCEGVAKSVEQAIALIGEKRPSLIFLDVELGADSGFDLMPVIRDFSTELPFVIILSEFEKYARQAINMDGCYFLDKPINDIHLSMALAKFRRHFSQQQRFLTIKDKSGHWFIQYENIFYIQADSNYCYVHRLNKKPIVVTKTLKDIEAMLPNSFLRTHKSFIINIAYIEKVNTTLRSILLHAKTSLFDLTLSRQGNTQEILPRELTADVPIGEMYLDAVKRTLLASKTR